MRLASSGPPFPRVDDGAAHSIPPALENKLLMALHVSLKVSNMAVRILLETPYSGHLNKKWLRSCIRLKVEFIPKNINLIITGNFSNQSSQHFLSALYKIAAGDDDVD